MGQTKNTSLDGKAITLVRPNHPVPPPPPPASPNPLEDVGDSASLMPSIYIPHLPQGREFSGGVPSSHGAWPWLLQLLEDMPWATVGIDVRQQEEIIWHNLALAKGPLSRLIATSRKPHGTAGNGGSFPFHKHLFTHISIPPFIPNKGKLKAGHNISTITDYDQQQQYTKNHKT